MTGLGESFFQVEAGAVIGDGEFQRLPTILHRDANLLRARVTIGIVGGFLRDA